jgi:hypothetical protein
LLQDTALNTIQDGLNLAFSELETSLLDEQQSGDSTKPTVEVTPARPATQIPQKAMSLPTLDLGFDSDNIVVEAEPVPVKQRYSASSRRGY